MEFIRQDLMARREINVRLMESSFGILEEAA
jgi:hypothetical protein